jgi:hypothetical protein
VILLNTFAIYTNDIATYLQHNNNGLT